MLNAEYAEQLTRQFKDMPAEEVLKKITDIFPETIAFSTSFGLEDQVVTHWIMNQKLPIRIFTLDTGRLFEETYKTAMKTMEKYGCSIEVFFPDSADIEVLTTRKGMFSFYESVENRKECCFFRKVKPLTRALIDVRCWITGLRADQSDARHELSLFEYDSRFNLIKYNPLLAATLDEVKEIIQRNQIPYNSLHDKGFISIGCSPCTRAILPDEPIRAGRWWWEDKSKKECGLHER